MSGNPGILVEKVAPEESGRDLDFDDLAEFGEPFHGICDACGGELRLMGSLGRMEHLNCPNCGLWFYRESV